MASQSKPFISAEHEVLSSAQVTDLSGLLEVATVFGLILIAVWTPQGHLNAFVCWAAALLTVALSIRGPYSAREMGLAQPFSGALPTIGTGMILVASITALGYFCRSLGPPQPLPWERAWQYAFWALLQQFIVQSFMFVRLETVFRSQRAVLLVSTLFAVAHIPSPVLTILSFLGAIFFCLMFRRYRNIYPLGFVHAALGLTIAATMPDSLMHHMRVGLGFLRYHP
jgi:hypothetical protein